MTDGKWLATGFCKKVGTVGKVTKIATAKLHGLCCGILHRLARDTTVVETQDTLNATEYAQWSFIVKLPIHIFLGFGTDSQGAFVSSSRK